MHFAVRCHQIQIADMVRRAQHAVCYAAPGIQFKAFYAPFKGKTPDQFESAQ